MSVGIGLIIHTYCILMCLVLVCPATPPVGLDRGFINDNRFRSKVLAAIEKSKSRASGTSSTSVIANSKPPAPSIFQTNPASPSNPQTNIPATSSGVKSTSAIDTANSDKTTTEKQTVTQMTESPSSSSGEPVKPQPSDTQSVEVNININNNINKRATTTTVQPRKTTPKPKRQRRLDCKTACKFISIPTCGCGPNDSWA